MNSKDKRIIARQKKGIPDTIHCACVIHGGYYGWQYVEKLYNGLVKYLSPKVILHVFTESNRPVPEPFVKHNLQEWPGIHGPKKSWWYKIQIFNPKHHKGQMLYFDLDTVIVGNIDWLWQLDTNKFWAIRDFKYLWKNRKSSINSSVMWFDTSKFSFIYQEFDVSTVNTYSLRKWHGDQDYINEKISHEKLAFLDVDRIKSYKWELKEGGYNFTTRKQKNPGSQTILDEKTSVLVFHGSPKPHEVTDKVILQNWI